jgi:hypothetical protein
MSDLSEIGEGQSRSPFELILVSSWSSKLVAGGRYELYSNYPFKFMQLLRVWVREPSEIGSHGNGRLLAKQRGLVGCLWIFRRRETCRIARGSGCCAKLFRYDERRIASATRRLPLAYVGSGKAGTRICRRRR